MMGIEFLGGLYLTRLGVRMLSYRRINAGLHDSPLVESIPPRAHLWRGLATDLANPKTVVFLRASSQSPSAHQRRERYVERCCWRLCSHLYCGAFAFPFAFPPPLSASVMSGSSGS